MPDVTVFYGFYGSGKTEIAMSYAISLAKQGKEVVLVDLDAVTPYFRVRDVEEELTSQGVIVVAPKTSVRHADLPVLPEGVRRVLEQGPCDVIIDVGGDPTGARVLGGLRDALSPDAKGLFVLNASRPFTQTVEDAKKAIAQVAASAGLQPGGLVANTHMTDQTTIEHVVYGVQFAREVGREMNLPVVFCAASVDLQPYEEELARRTGGLPVLWLTRLLKKPWE